MEGTGQTTVQYSPSAKILKLWYHHGVYDVTEPKTHATILYSTIARPQD